MPRTPSFTRDRWRRAILALLDKHGAVFLNDLLPVDRTPAQCQQLCRVAAELEDTGQIESSYFWFRFMKPGFKVLIKPGYEVEGDQVVTLKAKERLHRAKTR
jgi:hypothetical protein